MNSLVLTIVSDSVNDLNRAIARISLNKSAELVGSNDFRNAAAVMGKQLTPETSQRLSALNATFVRDIPSSVIDWLNELGNAICA